MSRTPETIKNKKAEYLRNVLIAVGVFFALASLGAYQNGDSPIIAALLCILSFFFASKVKVTWKKMTENSVYK